MHMVPYGSNYHCYACIYVQQTLFQVDNFCLTAAVGGHHAMLPSLVANGFKKTEKTQCAPVVFFSYKHQSNGLTCWLDQVVRVLLSGVLTF